jgi:hypothetical protein
MLASDAPGMQMIAAALSIFIGCIVVVPAVEESAPAVIALQPFSDVQAERLSVVKQGLEKAYSLKVETLPVKPLPKAACGARKLNPQFGLALPALNC